MAINIRTTITIRWFVDTGIAPDGNDLISEWIDAPEVDWSKMAAWHNWVARDDDGKWFAYSLRPEIYSDTWTSGKGYDFHGEIMPQHAPKFSGDWKDSLVCRPGVEK